MNSRKANLVTAREQVITIPTYGVGQPNKNPMFLEKRVYQGSSGVVYPHPIIENISDTKTDQEYRAIFLENRYLKIMLLPEIGGRVHMAMDKTNGYHFVYYNQVIKPALVGLTGPWISGGIEFNWPQHHRPSTFEPVDHLIQANPDGSKTVWMGEIERMFRTKGLAGFTLHPDKAYLEIQVQLYNRTSEPQTFLWWANPAVTVNNNYQSVFPPDVHAVMDHGKRDVSSFPIATGTYYKMDYAPGTDISRYKNIPVPTSYMAYHSDFDFLGCYDHGAQAGMMHVANHHIVPGKKQWTWGNGDFGQAWDRQLTDEDGPYIELMCGAFTDNQPDFSWLQPGEEKRFTQIFMPYKQIGPPKNASKDAVINLDKEGDTVKFGVYLSSPRGVRVILETPEEILYNQQIELDPTTALVETIPLGHDLRPQDLHLRVLADDKELVSYTPLPDEKPQIPPPAQAAKPPEEIASSEELFLNGLHLEQYRHATYEPEPYYLEAIKRDPLDSRANNAMGLLLYRRGRFKPAEGYFRKAIESLTRRNPNPYDGEPFYNLGLALKMQGRYTEAFDAFYKSVWNAAWQNPANFELARLACLGNRLEEALEFATEAIISNGRNHKARHLQVTLLRKLNQAPAAIQAAQQGLDLDPLNFGLYYEGYLLDGDEAYRELFRDNHHTYIEISLDYAHAGLFQEAIALLQEAPLIDPMVKYYLGWYHFQVGDLPTTRSEFEMAAQLSPDYCFPHRLEAVLALQTAINQNLNDARAPYYLGNLWYARRQYEEAITAWEQAVTLDSQYPTPYRNLGLAYMNKLQDAEKALEMYQTAFFLDPKDGRVLFELDQLYKKIGKAPGERLEFLETHVNLVNQRDDLTIERVTLLNLLGQHEEALCILTQRTFRPWEGGEGKVTGQYVTSLIEIAKKHIVNGAYDAAIECLQDAQVYPPNLGEGKLAGTHENHIFYYLGGVYQALGQDAQARQQFSQACIGSLEPVSPLYYNDQPPEMIYYQGQAYQILGQEKMASSIFQKLINYGEEHINDEISMDYFSVSLPDFLVFDEDLSQRNRIHCRYMMALGYLGLGQADQAAEQFHSILESAPHHLGATILQGELTR